MVTKRVQKLAIKFRRDFKTMLPTATLTTVDIYRGLTKNCKYRSNKPVDKPVS